MRFTPQLLIIMFSFFAHLGLAQEICTGSVGENIFPEGDFGSGIENILPGNPGIAPGFIYTTTVPIDDGFYNITNGTDRWASNWPTWLNIGDNSPDPNGYMMVVNASFTPGIFYDQVVNGLCDNTTYNFTADMINMIQAGVTNHILPDVTFLINGEVKFNTGPIPQDETWNTYGFSFQTGPGETSMRLTLRNNAPGGIGNDIALDNISFRPCGPDAIASTDLDGKVCEDSFEDIFLTADVSNTEQGYALQWQVSTDFGLTWTDIPGAKDSTYQITDFTSGQYLYRYLFAYSEMSLANPKCRTISSPQALEVVPLLWTVNDTICEGTAYQFGDITLNQPGTYVDSLISSIGCDSVVTLNLANVPPNQIELQATGFDPSCTDFEDGQIRIDSVIGAVFPVEFQLNGEIQPDLTLIDGLGSGDYNLFLTDRFGCTDEIDLTLINPSPFVAIGALDTTLRLGQSIIGQPLFSQPAVFWSWTPFEGLTCSECEMPIIQPLRTGSYEVLARNKFGCEAIYQFNFVINIEEVIFVPNIFSPNADSRNDYFGAYGDPLAQSPTYIMEVYDRWGNQVFSSDAVVLNEIQTAWDGTYNGQALATDVYTYRMIFQLINGDEIAKSGSITLLR